VATLQDLLIKVGIDSDGVHKGVGKLKGVSDKVAGSFNSTAKAAGGLVTSVVGIGAATPVVAGVAAGALSLGVAVGAAGVAMGVFGKVVGSAMEEVKEAVTQTETLEDKIEKYGAQAKVAAKGSDAHKAALKGQAKAVEELKAHLQSLPPDVRAMTESTLKLKDQWQGFVDQNKPAVYGMMTRGYKLLGDNVGKLQPLFDIGQKAATRFLGAIEKSVGGGLIERFAQRAGPAMDSLTGIIINVTRALGGMFGKIGDAQGQGILEWLDAITAKWAAWATATDADAGINKFVAFMNSSGGQTAALLADIAGAAVAVAKAVTPLAPVSMAVAGALAALIAAVPPGVITALVSGWIAYGIAVKAFAAYQAIATAAQWANNTAMLASPTTWIIAAILALVAVIVLIATKTTWFQSIWKAVWGFMKTVGAWFAGPFADFFVRTWAKIVASLQRARGQLSTAINGVKGFFTGLWNKWNEIHNKIIAKATSLVRFFVQMPGRIGGALRNMFSGLWQGFRGVANRIIGGWNNLSFRIGGGSVMGVSIPSVTLNTPNIPYLAEGGIVTGPTLAMIGEGRQDEAVIPLDRLPELAGRGDQQVVVQIMPGGEREFRRWVNKTIRVKGALGQSEAIA
jgi:hypothetical protein